MNHPTTPSADLTEAEWLDTWHQVHVRLEALRAEMTTEGGGLEVTVVQKARLDGEAAMLRRVLESRGVELD